MYRSVTFFFAALLCVPMATAGPPTPLLECLPPPAFANMSPLPDLSSSDPAVGWQGATQGAASVGGDGAAQYSVPIAVPPGRLGMEPSLGFSYSSNGGNSYLGMGFDLTGRGGAIARCGSNRADDGFIRDVMFDEMDHLCLDGLRLVEVPPTGAWSKEYRTRPDTDRRIVTNGGGFTVYSPSGILSHYGSDASSRIISANSAVLSWLQKKSVDRYGNMIEYEYIIDAAGDGHTREAYPVGIKYGGNEKLGIPNGRGVSFEYDLQNSAFANSLGYSHGLSTRLATARLMTKVVTYSETKTLREYRVSYQMLPQSHQPIVENIEDCAGPAPMSCRDPVRFGWQGVSEAVRESTDAALLTKTFVTSSATPNDSYLQIDRMAQIADFTGDGRPDSLRIRVVKETCNAGWTWVNEAHGLSLQYHSCQNQPSGVYYQFLVATNLGNWESPAAAHFSEFQPWLMLARGVNAPPDPAQIRIEVLDFNDDGKADLLIDDPELGTDAKRLALVTQASPGFVPQFAGDRLAPNETNATIRKSVQAWLLGDVDVDGKDDLIECLDRRYLPADPAYVADNCSDASERAVHARADASYSSASCKPSLAKWTVRLWRPGNTPGTGGFGAGVEVPALSGTSCLAANEGLVRVLDFDADKQPEIFALVRDPAFSVQVQYPGSYGWVSTQLDLSTLASATPHWNVTKWIWAEPPRLPFPELLSHSSTRPNVVQWGDSFNEPYDTIAPPYLTSALATQGDFNGDGLLDLFYYYPGGNTLVQTQAGKPSLFFISTLNALQPPYSPYFDCESLLFAENPDTFFDLQPPPPEVTYCIKRQRMWKNLARSRVHVFDYNRDGRDDIFLPGGWSSLAPFLSTGLAEGSLKQGFAALPELSQWSKREHFTWSTMADGSERDYVAHVELELPNISVADFDGDGGADLLVPFDRHWTNLSDEWGGSSLVEEASDKLYRLPEGRPLLSRVWTGSNLPIPPSGYWSDELMAADPGAGVYVPDVEFRYGRLLDPNAQTAAALQTSDFPAGELVFYRSQTPGSDACVYPRGCMKSPRQLVSALRTNDGQDTMRATYFLYRDGRFDRLGRGSIGFGSRLSLDLEAGTASVSRYDTVTMNAPFHVFPGASTAAETRSFSMPTLANPATDSTRLDVTIQSPVVALVATNNGATYKLVSTFSTATSEVSYSSLSFPTDLSAIMAFVFDPNRFVLDQTIVKTSLEDFDPDFQIPRLSKTWIEGTNEISEKTIGLSHDTSRWIIGQVEQETHCSVIGMEKRCRKSEADYDPDTGSVLESRRAPELYEAFRRTAFTYNSFGQIERTISDDNFGNHRESCTLYDTRHLFPWASYNGMGHLTTTIYDDDRGVLFAARDTNGLISRIQYDAFGTPLKTELPDGNTVEVWSTKNTVDAGGNGALVMTTSSGAGTASVWTDLHGRTTRVMRETGNVPTWFVDGSDAIKTDFLIAETTYDHFGRRIAQSALRARGDQMAEKLAAQWTYDNAGRVEQIQTPGQPPVTYSYKPWARQLVTTTSGTDALPAPRETVTTFDKSGRIASVEDAAGGVVQYGYGFFGLRTETVGVDGIALVNEYDAYGRSTWMDDPDRGGALLQYNGFDEVRGSLDLLLRSTTISYDALGRLETKSTNDGFYVYTYDSQTNGIGKPAAVIGPESTRHWTYDALGRVDRQSLVYLDGTAFATHNSYDIRGRLSRIDYPQGLGIAGASGAPFAVTYGYDSIDGTLVKVSDGNHPFDYWQLLGTDAAGRALTAQLGNGATVQQAFDPERGHLTAISATLAGTALQDFHFAYDARGNLIHRRDLVQPTYQEESFQYDSLDRLTCSALAKCSWGDDKAGCQKPASCDTSVDYLRNGNIDRKSDMGVYVYDAAHPHAVQAVNAPSGGILEYAYDAVGNQVSRPGVLDIAYNGFNLPEHYKLDSGAFVFFDYDDSGARIRKYRSDSAEETRYFGGLFERVTNANGAVEYRYYVSNGSERVAVVSETTSSPNATRRFVVNDHLGSGSTFVDMSGNVERQSFDAFGAERDSRWGSATSPPISSATSIGYTGHETDQEVGLVNAKGRLYDPKLARFLQADPVVSDPMNGQTLNPYTYVRNNPLKFTDPSGFTEEPNLSLHTMNATPSPFPSDSEVLAMNDGWVDIEVIGEPVQEAAKPEQAPEYVLCFDCITARKAITWMDAFAIKARTAITGESFVHALAEEYDVPLHGPANTNDHVAWFEYLRGERNADEVRRHYAALETQTLLGDIGMVAWEVLHREFLPSRPDILAGTVTPFSVPKFPQSSVAYDGKRCSGVCARVLIQGGDMFEDSHYKLSASLDNDGILGMNVQVGKKAEWRGVQLFDAAIERLRAEGHKINGVDGTWVSFLPDNMRKYMHNRMGGGAHAGGGYRGMNRFDAATGTWTGKRAEGLGFEPVHVEEIFGRDPSVKVEFRPPPGK